MAGQVASVGARAHGLMNLGRNDNIITVGEILYGPAQYLLAPAEAVEVGRIEEVDAHFQGFLADRPALPLVERPFLDPACRVAEPHAATADAGNCQAAGAYVCIFHVPYLRPVFRQTSLLLLSFIP